jgi:hypothetical protein
MRFGQDLLPGKIDAVSSRSSYQGRSSVNDPRENRSYANLSLAVSGETGLLDSINIVDAFMPTEIEVSIVMPCLNGADTLERCISKAQKAFRDNGILGEIVIADNGSTDGSQHIADRMGVRLVPLFKLR